MADEITVSASIRGEKGGLKVSQTSKSIDVDMAGEDYEEGVQLIGTAEEAITVGEITTPGYAMIINLDATNFVSIRGASGGANTIKLLPGEFCVYRMGTATPFAIADTAACRIHKKIFEA